MVPRRWRAALQDLRARLVALWAAGEGVPYVSMSVQCVCVCVCVHGVMVVVVTWSWGLRAGMRARCCLDVQVVAP